MYKLITKAMVRRAFRRLSQGDIETPLRAFANDVRFYFPGESALACDARSRAQARRWFERVLRLLPGIEFQVEDVVVNGMPWRTTVATHLKVFADLPDGSTYHNEAMQLIRIRWGRIVEDRIYEDTQRLARTLERLREHGVEEAAAEPVSA